MSTAKIAKVELIDYGRLLSKDPSEVKKLLDICQSSGIFHLDLRGAGTQAALEDLQDAYKASTEFFRLPRETKMESFRDGLERGFKPFSGSETYEMARDEVAAGTLVLPEVLRPYKTQLSRLSSTCDAITRHILSCLTESLNMTIPEVGVTGSVTPPSDTGLKLCYKAGLKNPGEVTSKEHTDFGLITLLFYDQPTLQLPTEDKSEWALVEPIEGCAVVNVADSLQARSGNRLHSPLHRVIQPEGPRKERYSVVYFLRQSKE